jgi:outer membrane protein assembly factor BamB
MLPPFSIPASAPANAAADLVTSPEEGWPQWRGPRRDGISHETGLLPRWPEGGPTPLWKTSGMGHGYSSPIITGGRIFLTGDLEEKVRIFALDLEGKLLWQAANGPDWKRPYPGARATLTYSEGRLYHLNAHGRLACFDAATGKEEWSLELFEEFGGRNITWALSECLLVDGQKLIVTPGGTQAVMAALDKKTGKTIWTAGPLRLGPADHPEHQRLPSPAGEVDNASYASPILFTLGGRRHIVSCSLRHVFGVDAETGELLWTRPLPTRYGVIAATPVLVGNAVFVTAPHGKGGHLYRLHDDGDRVQVETLWNTTLDTCQGGVIHMDGALYGSFYDQRGWGSVDAGTGKMRYQTDALAMGSAIFAEGLLYCLSQEGEMALLKPTADGFEFMGRFPLVTRRVTDAWAHPVILDGRLYLRYHDTLYCFDIRRPQ